MSALRQGDEAIRLAAQFGLQGEEVADLRPQQEAFDAYVAAQTLAKETLSFAHACAAGRAWARFIDLYLPADRRIGGSAAR